MNLTIKQYKEMRLSGMSDEEVLVACGYSPKSNRVILKWKKDHSVKQGKSMIQFLDRAEVFKYMRYHSVKETAQRFNVPLRTFYRWEKIERMKWNESEEPKNRSGA